MLKPIAVEEVLSIPLSTYVRVSYVSAMTPSAAKLSQQTPFAPCGLPYRLVRQLTFAHLMLMNCPRTHFRPLPTRARWLSPALVYALAMACVSAAAASASREAHYTNQRRRKFWRALCTAQLTTTLQDSHGELFIITLSTPFHRERIACK